MVMIISKAMAIDCSRLSGRISSAANSNFLLLDLPNNDKLKKTTKNDGQVIFLQMWREIGGMEWGRMKGVLRTWVGRGEGAEGVEKEAVQSSTFHKLTSLGKKGFWSEILRHLIAQNG